MKLKAIKPVVDLILRIIPICVGFMMLSQAALAENNSSSIFVSCSIPAIPGINAPLIEVKNTTTETSTESTKEQETQNKILSIPKEIRSEAPTMIQTTENKILLAESQGSVVPVEVQTIYSR